MSILLWVLFGLVGGGNLLVHATIQPLGDGGSATVTASADVDATYVCVNKRGISPRGLKKEHFVTVVSKSSVVDLDPDVRTPVDLPLSPPGPSLSCPRGLDVRLESATYTGVTLSVDGEEVGSLEDVFNWQRP